MNATTPARAKPRATLNVDLGELRGRLDAAADEAGVKPSEWVRRAVSQALETAASGRTAATPAAAMRESAATRGVHLELDVASAARLDALAEQGGFRSRVGVLRALLGAGPAPGGDASLAEALQALRISNTRLANLELDLKAFARGAVTAGDAGAEADSCALERAVRAAHTHVEIASKVVAGLSPVLKLGKDFV